LRRIFLVFESIILTLILSSCASTVSKIEPIKTELIYFDINTAIKMIEEGEKIIADITIKDTVSRQEYNQFLCDMDDAYDGYEEVQWQFMFFYNNEFENEEISTIHLNKEMLYPTIYHENVKVVSAKIENTYYQDENLNSSILIIREEYLGDDSRLEDWYREYLYQKNSEDEWVFYAIGGQINLSGEGITSDLLEIK